MPLPNPYPGRFLTCGKCNKPFPDEATLRAHTERVDAAGDQHDGEPWGSVESVVVAEWKDDCQGKKDFDGAVVVLSTRYWPPPSSGHGSTLLRREHGAVTVETLPYGEQASAHAAIALVQGKHGDFLALTDEHFYAPTEAEVKAAVEAWAKLQAARVWRAVIAEFARDEPARGWTP